MIPIRRDKAEAEYNRSGYKLNPDDDLAVIDDSVPVRKEDCKLKFEEEYEEVIYAEKPVQRARSPDPRPSSAARVPETSSRGKKNRHHNHVLVPVDQDMTSLMISVNHQQDRSIEPTVDLGHTVDQPVQRKKFDLTRNEISSIMIDSLKAMEFPMKKMSKTRTSRRTTVGKLGWTIFSLLLDSHS